MVSAMVIVGDEGFDPRFQIAGQVIVFQQEAAGTRTMFAALPIIR